MAQLSVKLGDDKLRRLKQYARGQRSPVSWLIRDYVDYLLTGGRPVRPVDEEEPSDDELARLAQRGGALDWLEEEPELYTAHDGEPL